MADPININRRSLMLGASLTAAAYMLSLIHI